MVIMQRILRKRSRISWIFDCAKSVLSSEEKHDSVKVGEDNHSCLIPRILITCFAYSIGVIAAILLSNLSQVHNYTETLFRNLISLEHCCKDCLMHVTSYALFMGGLIQ